MQRTIALSCLISLVTQPAMAQPQKEVSIAFPGAIVSAPPPVSQHAQAPTRRELQDLTRRAYPRTHYQRGQYFLQKGDPNSALIEFLKATQENPRLVRAFYEQALIFEQRGYLKLAESSLQQALAVDPQYQKARVLLATIQLKQGNIGGAVSELSRSLGLAENAQKARPSQPAEHPPSAPAAVPPPSLLQVIHSILPEPPAEPPPAPQAAQPGIQEDEPSYKLSSPPQEPASDGSPEKRTGFAGMPSLPQEVGAKQPKGELDDILKGIPGIDPDVPATGQGDLEKLTGARTAGDDKQEKRSRQRKEKRKAPEFPAAAAPTDAGQDRHSHIHLPNPFSIFRQDPPVERISEPKTPKPSARAERLGQKAEKLKWKAEKLRKKADKLGLKEGKQSENLDSELTDFPHGKTVPGSLDNSIAGVMPAGVAQPAKKHGREKSRGKQDKKGILSGLFSIFQPEAPPAVSALREAERQSGSEKKKAEAAGQNEPESFGMVVRQPQAQEPLDSQPDGSPGDKQRHKGSGPEQPQASLVGDRSQPLPPPQPRRLNRAPTTQPRPAEPSASRQTPAQARPSLPTPGQLISSLTAILSPPTPSQRGDKRAAPAPLPQAVYIYQPSGSPALPAQRPVSAPAQHPAPLAVAMQSLQGRQEQAPRPAVASSNQWMVSPQFTTAGQVQPSESFPAPAPANAGRNNLVYEAPAPTRAYARPLDPLLVTASVPDSSAAGQNTAVLPAVAAAQATQPVSQPTGTVKIASARPAGARRASGTTIVIPPPPPGSGPVSSPPLTPLSPSYDQTAPDTIPSNQSVADPQAQANAAARTSRSNWHGQRFQSPTMPSSRMTWLALTPGQSQANKQASQPAPDEDEWTKRLRYLAEHGTAGLKQGEAFMFSEETGEAVLFMPKGESIRRKVAPPQDPDEVVKARRPDILQPQELQYNLSLLGKLLPHQPEQSSTAPSADKSDPLANFNISDVLRNSNRFWEWLKQTVSF